MIAYKELIELVTVDEIKSEQTNKKDQNELSFVFSGSFKPLTRQELEQTTLKKGFKVKKSVSKDLSYLVVGEKPGQKVDIAKKLKIKIINIDQWREIVK